MEQRKNECNVRERTRSSMHFYILIIHSWGEISLQNAYSKQLKE